MAPSESTLHFHNQANETLLYQVTLSLENKAFICSLLRVELNSPTDQQ